MSLHRNIGTLGTVTKYYTTMAKDGVVIVEDDHIKQFYPFGTPFADQFDVNTLQVIPANKEFLDFEDYVLPVMNEQSAQVAANVPETDQQTVYVTGNIIDKKSGDIIRGTIQLFNLNTMLKLSDPYFVDNGNYAAWTNQDPAMTAVRFTADGYKEKLLTINDLTIEPDVYLDKGSSTNYTPILFGLILLAIAARKKKKKVGAINTNTVLAVGLGIVFLKGFGLFTDFLKFLGVSKGEGTKEAENESQNSASAFKPTYWQQFSIFPNGAFTESQVKEFSKTIHNAFTVFQDDFNAIMSVFSQMQSKANVSFLAWKFAKQYNEDLLSFLRDGGGILPWDGLNESHLKTIIDLVNNLPTN